jgi:hypothetical protein
VRQVLRYEPETGRFFWLEKIADKVVVGAEAGNATGRRDVRISIDGVLYQGHRLAWVIMTGEQPPSLVDHHNRDTRDNRWGNLRPADESRNAANRTFQANSRSRVKGVYFYPKRKSPWLARLSCQGVIRLNRYFPTQQEASAAYEKAGREFFGPYWSP